MIEANIMMKRLAQSFHLWEDLASSLDGTHLGSKLGDLPSNAIGHQLWCVVGARESYLNAEQSTSPKEVP